MGDVQFFTSTRQAEMAGCRDEGFERGEGRESICQFNSHIEGKLINCGSRVSFIDWLRDLRVFLNDLTYQCSRFGLVPCGTGYGMLKYPGRHRPDSADRLACKFLLSPEGVHV